MLPDNWTLQANASGTLKCCSTLSKKAATASVVPGLKNESLVPLGQLCDNECEVLLTNKNFMQ